MDPDKAQMWADLGVDRRDEVSAPEEGGRNRAAVAIPREPAAIRREVDARRQNANTGNGSGNGAPAAWLAAWNNADNFERDAVSSQLPDRWGGQGHRLGLAASLAAASDHRREDNRPSHRSEEREQYLREHNRAAPGPSAGRGGHGLPPASRFTAPRAALATASSSRRLPASTTRSPGRQRAPDPQASGVVRIANGQRHQVKPSSAGSLGAAALREAAARQAARQNLPAPSPSPSQATPRAHSAAPSRANGQPAHPQPTTPPRQHSIPARTPGSGARRRTTRRNRAASRSSTHSSASSVPSIGLRAAAMMREVAARQDAQALALADATAPLLPAGNHTAGAHRAVIAIAYTGSQMGDRMNEARLSQGSATPTGAHARADNTSPLLARSPIARGATVFQQPANTLSVAPANENNRLHSAQPSKQTTPAVENSAKSNRTPRAANIVAPANPALVDRALRPVPGNGRLMQSRWATPDVGAAVDAKSFADPPVSIRTQNRSALLSRGPTHPRAEALLNHRSPTDQRPAGETTITTTSQDRLDTAMKKNGRSTRTSLFAPNPASSAPNPTVMRMFEPTSQVPVTKTFDGKSNIGEGVGFSTAQDLRDSASSTTKPTFEAAASKPKIPTSATNPKPSAETSSAAASETTHTPSQIQVFKTQALYYAAALGDECDAYYAKHPDRKKYFGQARDQLIKDAFDLIHANDERDLRDYIEAHPVRGWIVDAAMKAKQQVEEDDQATVQRYCIANPNHKPFLRAAQCIYKPKSSKQEARTSVEQSSPDQEPPGLVSSTSSGSSSPSSVAALGPISPPQGTVAATFYNLAGTFLGIHQDVVDPPVLVNMSVTSRSDQYDPRSLATAVQQLADSMKAGLGLNAANGGALGGGCGHTSANGPVGSGGN